jgi:hypothetical protein
MNERIKLPAQVWLGYDPEKGDLHGYTFQQMREFAELIVKECAEVLDETISPPSHPMNSIGYRLKEHFGVKE